MLLLSWLQSAKSLFAGRPASRQCSTRGVLVAVEICEQRTVLAATIIASLSAEGVLTIEGTEQQDNIVIGQVSGQVSINGVQITVDGNLVDSVAASEIDRIEINALGGDDRIEFQVHDDPREAVSINVSITGGDGNDFIIAGSGNDSLDGGAGNDRIFGGLGHDSLSGGAGNDELMGDAGNDTVAGGAGRDAIHGGSGNDSLNGGSENDHMVGENGNDSILGGDGNDRLEGNRGLDHLDGEAGDDDLFGGRGNDRLAGGLGDDLLKGGEGRDRLNGGTGRDTLRGSGGKDSLFHDVTDIVLSDRRDIIRLL